LTYVFVGKKKESRAAERPWLECLNLNKVGLGMHSATLHIFEIEKKERTNRRRMGETAKLKVIAFEGPKRIEYHLSVRLPLCCRKEYVP
jgi:hypothetical protein